MLDHVHTAVVGAVADGRLDEVRLAEAAEQAGPGRRGTAPTARAGGGPCDLYARGPGGRCGWRARWRCRAGRPNHVVELRPEPNIAAGEVPWGLRDQPSRPSITRASTVHRSAAGG